MRELHILCAGFERFLDGAKDSPSVACAYVLMSVRFPILENASMTV